MYNFTIYYFYKVKYDRPGECSPEKDCLRWHWLTFRQPERKSSSESSDLCNVGRYYKNSGRDVITVQNPTKQTLTLHLTLQWLYRTSKELLKLSLGSYSLTTSVLLTDPSLPYENYWLTSKTKTNLGTDKEQFIRSNAATARPLISVRPAEIWTLDWLNTDERRGTVTSTITLLNTIYRQTTESTGTLLHVLPTTLTTTNGSYWKAGLLT